jgi:hypothetical protein
MRKYRGNYKGKLPNGIHKHTKVRRRVSRFGIQLGDKVPVVIGDSESKLAPLVQDIKPVREVSVAGYAEKLISLFNERLEENKKTIILEQDEIIPPKPKSLLERLTNKIRRKDNGK